MGCHQYKTLFVVVALLCAQTVVRGYTPIADGKDDKCETLTSDFCRKMDYNRTIFPNYFGHRKQSEAMAVVNSLQPLIKVGCSPDLLTFLCSVYFPMCTSINKIILPCRSLCLDVRKGCMGLLVRFGYIWPKDLRCDQFPSMKTDICVFQNKTGAVPASTVSCTPTTFSITSTRKIETTKKVVPPSSHKAVQKRYCPADKSKQWNSDAQRDCCKCCLRGNRAARSGKARCTVKKSYSKEKSFLKTLKECPSRKTKRCYLDCCNAKRKEVKSKRRNKQRKNKNRRRRKKPVG